MEETNKKQCPKCNNLNVFDTGSRTGQLIKYKLNEPMPEPKIPYYECNDCGKRFVYLGK